MSFSLVFQLCAFRFKSRGAFASERWVGANAPAGWQFAQQGSSKQTLVYQTILRTNPCKYHMEPTCCSLWWVWKLRLKLRRVSARRQIFTNAPNKGKTCPMPQGSHPWLSLLSRILQRYRLPSHTMSCDQDISVDNHISPELTYAQWTVPLLKQANSPFDNPGPAAPSRSNKPPSSSFDAVFNW